MESSPERPLKGHCAWFRNDNSQKPDIQTASQPETQFIRKQLAQYYDCFQEKGNIIKTFSESKYKTYSTAIFKR